MADIKRLILLLAMLILIPTATAPLWYGSGDNTGLVGKWSCEGDFKDSSGQGNHGTQSGGVTITRGVKGTACGLDGADSFISVGTGSTLLLNGNITISAWVKMGINTTGYHTPIIVRKDGGGQAASWGLYVTNSNRNLSFEYYNGSAWFANYAAIGYGYVPIDTWTLISATKNDTQVTYYINGAAVGSKNTIGLGVGWAGQTTRIGYEPSWPGYANGSIDEARIYNRSLSASEILALYNTSKSYHVEFKSYPTINGNNETPAPELSDNTGRIIWYKMDTNASDSSGQGNNGAITGAINTSGRWDNAYKFDGVDDVIYSTSGINHGMNNWSASAWFKADSFISNGGLIGQFVNTGENMRWHILIGTGWGYYLKDNLSNQVESSISSLFETGRWYFVTQVVDRTNNLLKLYVNANNVGNINIAGLAGMTGGSVVRIGKAASGAQPNFNGTIDEVRIYNRSLTDAEVKELYLSKGLVGKWTFDANSRNTTDTYDASGYNNHGKITGATQTNEGRFKEAYKFDGVNDVINITSSQSLNLTGNITISAWIKTSHTGGSQTILAKINPADPWNGYTYNIGGSTNNNKLSFWNGNYPSYAWVSADSTYNDGAWHLATITMLNTNVTFYKDGVFDGTQVTGTRTTSSPNDLWIGVEQSTPRRFNGTIDDLRIYNRALTAAEVAGLYNGTKTFHLTFSSMPTEGMSNETPAPTASNESDLILYLKMDDLMNSNTTDSSGRGNNGSIYQAAYNTSGRWGSAYTFDGTDDYIRLLRDINLPNTNWTTTAWVKTSDPNAAIFGNWNGGPVDSGLWIKAGLISYAHYTGVWAYSNGTSNVSDERWHFLSWVKRDTGGAVANKIMDFYVDGTAETTGAPAYTTANGPMNQLGRDWGNVLAGLIDEVRIYNRSLSAAQIQELYLSKGLVGKWNFDANNRNTTDTYDSSGYNNHGKISGAALTNEGRFKEAYKFDGSNDCIVVGNSSTLNPSTAMTLGAWIYINSGNTNYGTILSRWNNVQNSYWIGTYPSSSKIDIYFSGSLIYTTPILPTNQWIHFAVTHNGSNVSAYKNGEYLGSGLSGSITTSTINTSIGYDYNRLNYAFNGTIDEVRIYNRALTATEIGQLYNGTKSEHLTWWSVPG